MRILRSNGTTITGTVRVNCVLEATPGANATIERLKQAATAGR